mmetsp:Transcript_40031/g.74610  ORF Transcript_40031/g.74610 Transcript_40031/m.74610 type:complete len:432 (+) Transcript_40031:696-1991(+)
MVKLTQHVLDVALGLRIERACEVRAVFLTEGLRGLLGNQRIVAFNLLRFLLVIVEDASCRKVGHVDSVDGAKVCQRQCTHHVHSNGLLAMRLAPVHVGPARQAGGVHHMRAAAVEKLALDTLTVLQARVGPLPCKALLGEEVTNHATDPASPAKNQELDLLGLLDWRLNDCCVLGVHDCRRWKRNGMCHQHRIQVTAAPEGGTMNREPIHGLFQTLIELHSLLPAQLLKLLQVQEIAHIIERSVSDMLNHLLRLHAWLHHFDNLLDNVDHRVFFRRANVVRAACHPLVQNNVEGRCNIFHMQVGSLADTIAMNCEFLVPGQHHDHLWDQFFRILAWAVNVVATGHQDGQAIRAVVGFDHHLSSGLGGCVRVGGVQRRRRLNLHVSLITVGSIFAIDLVCADMDVSLDLVLQLFQDFQDSVGSEDVVIGERH